MTVWRVALRHLPAVRFADVDPGPGFRLSRLLACLGQLGACGVEVSLGQIARAPGRIEVQRREDQGPNGEQAREKRQKPSRGRPVPTASSAGLAEPTS